MGRQDQMEALYEFFGGAVGTYVTSPSSVFPDIKTVSKGEPLRIDPLMMPAFYITAPKSKETREYAQKKFITYQLSAVLVWWTPGLTQKDAYDDRAQSALIAFYGTLEEVAARIRTNKQLITTSYPLGASIKFGETFTIDEQHERTETELLMVARFDIESVEQVNA